MMITTTNPMMIAVSDESPPIVPARVGVAPTGVGSVLPIGVNTGW